MKKNYPRVLTVVFVLSFLALLFNTGNLLAFAQQKAESNPITQITVSRGACFGPCPVYAVTLNADSSALYEGTSHVPRKGTYSGRFYNWKKIAAAFDSDGFFDLNSDYSATVTDYATVLTIATRKDGSKKRIRDYVGRGPQALWELETLVDGAVANTDWKLKDDRIPVTRY